MRNVAVFVRKVNVDPKPTCTHLEKFWNRLIRYLGQLTAVTCNSQHEKFRLYDVSRTSDTRLQAVTLSRSHEYIWRRPDVGRLPFTILLTTKPSSKHGQESRVDTLYRCTLRLQQDQQLIVKVSVGVCYDHGTTDP